VGGVVPEFTADQQAVLNERLRREARDSTVPHTLPVLFFGDLLNARIATIGLNPSWQEYLSPIKQGKLELTGLDRRFETLTSLDSSDRSALTDQQCTQAIDTMCAYFQPGKPIYSWFRALDRVTRGLGYSYERGEVAHLDLIQEATDPAWSELGKKKPEELRSLRQLDQPFLRWEIEQVPLTMLVCNGKTVFDTVRTLLNGRVVCNDKMALITWYIATARVIDRTVSILGWNIPLARATGLGTEGEKNLGSRLATHLPATASGQ